MNRLFLRKNFSVDFLGLSFYNKETDLIADNVGKYMNNMNNRDDGPGQYHNSGQTILILVIAAVVTFFIYTMARGFFVSGVTQELSYTEFLQMVDHDMVRKVEGGSSDITVYP